jgi:hypothetical protein
MNKRIIFIVFGLCSFFASAQTFPSMESGKYSPACEDKWTKKGVVDQNMFNYCMDLQRQGYSEALQTIKKFKDQPWIQNLIENEIITWTKKGSRNDEMIAYNLRLETDAFEELVLASKKQGFDNNLYEKCYSENRTRFTMIWYCYKENI